MIKFLLRYNNQGKQGKFILSDSRDVTNLYRKTFSVRDNSTAGQKV
jgi:hypothetical protein